MISHVRGKLTEKTSTHVVVEAQGVGFLLNIPVSSYRAIGEIGDEVCVLSHLHTREDVLQLFGFATAEERDVFRLLIGVSGVGPKLAQGILSGISVEEFRQAVRTRDVSLLTKAPGVGRKTAERLVLELKEKIDRIELPFDPDETGQAPSSETDEAVLALVSLGYKPARAQAAVRQIENEEPSLSVEKIIRAALRRL